MNTREELLNGLTNAVSIIRQLANVQKRLSDVRKQYKPHEPSTKFKKVTSWYLVLLIAIILWSIIGDIGVIIGIVAGFFLRKYYFKYKNEKIDQKNQALLTNENAILTELKKVQALYRENLSSWYPENYCSVDAVEFFHSTIKNYRADNLKEAINLYEISLHQRRVENTQKQALQEQRFANMANLIMQGAALGEMSRHNAVTEFELQKTNRTLDNIRNGF